ncbi:MAG: nitroreductase family protein [Candidatus Adiutrix sp.]|jgi:SagB-type dehydrogenase family enzyme|nr:nitroreductase family protein [Candidatus Adiutrix sp.]
MPANALTMTLAFLTVLAISAPASAQPAAVKLAQPDFNAPGLTVLKALQNRKSDRAFADRDLDLRHLSEVLWAAGGINRQEMPGGGVGRTAPSGRNVQAIEIFAVTRDGVYRYDPPAHELKLVTGGDHRAQAGDQDYVAAAPLNLIYVADLNKFTSGGEADKKLAAAIDLGHISENVYLYCASAGLNVVARTSIKPGNLASALKLEAGRLPMMGQTIGYKQ